MSLQLIAWLIAVSTVQQLPTPQGQPSKRHQVSPDGGVQRVEGGILSPPMQGDLPEAVHSWVLLHGKRYGLPTTSTLKFSEAFRTRFGATLHFVQVVQGVEVYRAKLVVGLDTKNRIVTVTSSLEAVSRVLHGPVLSLEAVLRQATQSMKLPLHRTANGAPHGTLKRSYFRVGSELHSGYLVHVETIDVSQNWYIALDSVTGKRLFAQNRVYKQAPNLSLKANVYPVNPGGRNAGVGVTPTQSIELKHSDGASMIDAECPTVDEEGKMSVTPNSRGELCGTKLTMYNCCPTENCIPDAKPKRVQKRLQWGDTSYALDFVSCDRKRRASNTQNPTGDYVYQPFDPPEDSKAITGNDRANSDEFAEVHAFYHTNRAYDWVRSLSVANDGAETKDSSIQPFTLNDERRMPAQKMAVWVNFIVTAWKASSCQETGTCQALELQRITNAGFAPYEVPDSATRVEHNSFPLHGNPPLRVNVIIFFQGDTVDPAYDATVAHHEFGHAVVHSTAELSRSAVAIDKHSGNAEANALHEGFSDYIAGAFNESPQLGSYFGARLNHPDEGAMRDEVRHLENTYRCPEMLSGQSHGDGLLIASALWEARMQHFQGDDDGDTFDAAFYAMLVGLTPKADFAMTAQVMSNTVQRAFPTITDAKEKMDAMFKKRGVIDCSKVVDFSPESPARRLYVIPELFSHEGLIPGPVQFKIPASKGASRVKLFAERVLGELDPYAASTNEFEGDSSQETSNVTLLVKVGEPITFTDDGNSLKNNADASAALSLETPSLETPPKGTSTVSIDVPCGQDVYATLGAKKATVLQGITFFVAPAEQCEEQQKQPQQQQQQQKQQGCGCAATLELGFFGLLPLLALRRRHRAKANSS